MVTSDAMGFPLDHRINVTPSTGLLSLVSLLLLLLLVAVVVVVVVVVVVAAAAAVVVF